MKESGLLHFAVEFVGVSTLSMLIGIAIGAVQNSLCYIFQSGSEYLGIAITEGAVTGGMTAIPVGWFCYYAICNRKADRKLWWQVSGTMLMTGIGLGVLVGLLKPEASFLTALAMAPLTLLITAGLRFRQTRTA